MTQLYWKNEILSSGLNKNVLILQNIFKYLVIFLINVEKKLLL